MYSRAQQWLRRLLPVCVALLLAAPALLRAQIDQCICSKIPLTVESTVRCEVTFLLTYEESGVEEKVTVKPGTSVNIACERGLQIFVLECGTAWRKVPEGDCLFNFNAGLAKVCCVDVCLISDDLLGCWRVDVRPTISGAITCPCRY